MSGTCQDRVDVAIVGGGLSGLVVALLLEELNMSSWRLLEANEERFGGRLMNTPSGIDVGAAWIFHGQRKMLKLANKLGLKTFPQPGDPSTSRVAGGTVAIPEAIAAQLPADKISKNFQVISCSHGSDKLITLSSSSGTTVVASKVVFAVPPKLIHDRVTFTPPLPADKTRAMNSAHTWMAGVTKIVLEYKDKFWPDGAVDTGLPRQLGPGFQVYDGSTEDSAVPAITFFALAPAAVADETVGKQCAAQLAAVWQRMGLAQHAGRLPAYHTAWVHRWPLEKYVSVETDPQTINPHPAPVRVLGRPEWDRTLLFASSEADLEAPGLMEGAVGAAERVVSELRGSG